MLLVNQFLIEPLLPLHSLNSHHTQQNPWNLRFNKIYSLSTFWCILKYLIRISLWQVQQKIRDEKYRNRKWADHWWFHWKCHQSVKLYYVSKTCIFNQCFLIMLFLGLTGGPTQYVTKVFHRWSVFMNIANCPIVLFKYYKMFFLPFLYTIYRCGDLKLFYNFSINNPWFKINYWNYIQNQWKKWLHVSRGKPLESIQFILISCRIVWFFKSSNVALWISSNHVIFLVNIK